MEQMGMKKKDLAEVIGYKSRVSEVLNRKRKLTLKMIRNLHEKLNIPYESLITKYWNTFCSQIQNNLRTLNLVNISSSIDFCTEIRGALLSAEDLDLIREIMSEWVTYLY